MDDLELEILSLLPKVRDTTILEQVAFILGADVDENIRGNVRSLNRCLISYLTSTDFDNLTDREERLGRIIRLVYHHLRGGGDRGSDVGVGGNDGDGMVNANIQGGGGDLVVQVGDGPPPALPAIQGAAGGFFPRPPSLPRQNLFPSHGGFGFGFDLGGPRYPGFDQNRLRAPGVSAPDQANASAPSPHTRDRMQGPSLSVTAPSFSTAAPRVSAAAAPPLSTAAPPVSAAAAPPFSAAGPTNYQPRFGSPSQIHSQQNGVQFSQPLVNNGGFATSTPAMNPNNPFSPRPPPNAAPVFNFPQPNVSGLSGVQNPAQQNLLQQFDPLMQGYPNQRPYGRMRELKLNGQIGNPGEAGKLSYSSLSFQISNARVRHFDDAEICSAVIRAITPNLPLRNYLERQRNLTLPMLISTLRTHFLLKNATASYNDMGNAVQQSGEAELCFCMNVMGMRDDVLALSQEEGGLYTEELVQRQMQHVLSVGFLRASVRQAMRALLRTPNLTDDVIFAALKEIVMNEAEHDAKANGATPVTTAASATPAVRAAPAKAAAVNNLSCDVAELLLEEVAKINQKVENVEKLQRDFQSRQQNNRQRNNRQQHQNQQPQQPQQLQQQPQQNMNGGGAAGPALANINAAAPVSGNAGGGGFQGGQVATGGFQGGQGGFQGGSGGGFQGGGGFRGNNGGARRRMQKCDRCNQVGPGSQWDHCFHCCGQGHKSADCPQKNANG